MPRLQAPSKEASALLPPFLTLPDRAIHVPRTADEFAQARRMLLSCNTLGFDTESKPIFSIHQVDTGPHVVQLASTEAAWLLQLHHSLALELAREVLATAALCKVGFGLDNDKQSLPRKLGVEIANIVDLDRSFKRQGYGSSVGVRAAVALVLGQSFRKSKKTSTSNWAVQELSLSQLRYAANDAHAPAVIYSELAQWEARQPPVPARKVSVEP